MKKLCLAVALVVCVTARVSAQPVNILSYRCGDGSLPTTTAVNAVFVGAGNSEVVALQASKQIRLLRWQLQSTADIQLKFVYGTGSACASGETDLVGRMDPFDEINRPVDSETLLPPIVAPVSQALCIDVSGAATLTGFTVSCFD